MAAPTYATDLTNISTAESVTNWTNIGTGAVSLETDYFIQGAGCISKVAWSSALRGIIYNNAAGITVPTDGAVMTWIYYSCANSLDTQANGGIRVIVGSSTTAYKHWYVSGKDLLTVDVWRPYPVDTSLTADATTGAPTATLQYFGSLANIPSTGPSKGNPLGVDVIRYGRCTLQITNGDLANGYGTFSGAEAFGNDVSRRWGLLEYINGSYFMQGFLSLGLSGTSVDFRDSNKVLFIRDTKKVSTNFNRIEVLNASSNVEWTNISIYSLGTTSKGTFIVTAGTVTLDGCQFTDMNTFAFLSSSVVTDTTFRRCGQITAPGTNMARSIVDSSTVAADTSAVVWNVATDPDGYLDDMEFVKGTNAHHAIELGTSSPTTVTLRGLSFTGFNAANGQNDSVIHVKRTTGTVTINAVGTTGTVSYKSDGATVTVVIDPVTTSITVLDITNNAAVQSARVLVTASNGTGPLPYQDSVTITGATENAVVFDAYADRLAGTNVPTADTNYTMSTWFRLDTAPTSTFTSVPLALSRGNAGDYYHSISIDENLGLRSIDNAGASSVLRTLALNTWYYVALSVTSGGSMTLSLRAWNEDTFSTVSKTAVSGPWTPTEVNVSGWDLFGTAVKGRMAHARIWNRVLSASELYSESLAATPVSSTNLLGAWALAGSTNRGVAITGSALTDVSTGPWGTSTGPLTVATVAHTAHGMEASQKILIKGSDQIEYNGVKTITSVVNANSYTYLAVGAAVTPATGTIVATGVVIDGVTDINGVITDLRSWSSSQPITGRVRKATGGTVYRTGTVSGTISNTTGFSTTIQMIRD